MDGVKSILASKTFWGAAIAIATPIVGYFGIEIDPETQQVVVDQVVAIAAAVSTAVGGLIAIYGRFKAKKTIGK